MCTCIAVKCINALNNNIYLFVLKKRYCVNIVLKQKDCSVFIFYLNLDQTTAFNLNFHFD